MKAETTMAGGGVPLARRQFLLGLAGVSALAVACGGDDAPSGGNAGKGSATGGKGLLIARDQRLVVRDMASGKENEIKRAAVGGYYIWPRWSPDGSKVAYVINYQFTGLANQDWGGDLAVANADGSDERIVLKHPSPGFTIEGLDWAHDGSALYAGTLDTQIQNGRFLGQTLKLERVDLATGTRTAVAEEGAYPTVAKDGSRIAYVASGARDSSQAGLWTARPDGSERKVLVPLSQELQAVAAPRFSPDGKQIAYSAGSLSGAVAPRPREREPWYARLLPWQASKVEAHGLPQDLWLVTVESGQTERRASLVEDEPHAAWSSDGTKIAVIGAGALYEIPMPAGEPKKVGQGAIMTQIDWH